MTSIISCHCRSQESHGGTWQWESAFPPSNASTTQHSSRGTLVGVLGNKDRRGEESVTHLVTSGQITRAMGTCFLEEPDRGRNKGYKAWPGTDGEEVRVPATMSNLRSLSGKSHPASKALSRSTFGQSGPSREPRLTVQGRNHMISVSNWVRETQQDCHSLVDSWSTRILGCSLRRKDCCPSRNGTQNS